MVNGMVTSDTIKVHCHEQAPDYRDNKIHMGWLDSRIAMRVRAEGPPWYLSVVGDMHNRLMPLQCRLISPVLLSHVAARKRTTEVHFFSYMACDFSGKSARVLKTLFVFTTSFKQSMKGVKM
nr:acetyl-CoA carboxylase 1-like [Tanacetum cinerariifolium]